MTEAYLILELTTRCNLDCRYCYNVWKAAASYPQGDMALPDLMAIIRNVTGATRIGGITLAGGEPLLNKQFPQIVEFLHQQAIPLSVTTNGLLLDELRIDHLRHNGVKHIEISLPTVDADIFDRMCGSKEVAKVRTAVLKVKQAGLRCSVSSVITRLNHLQLRGIIELAAAFGADTFLFNRFIPGGKGLLNMEGLALTNSDLLKALQEADRASADFHIPVTVPIPVEHCEFDTAHLTHLAFGTCTCGKDKWVVDPFGNLRICEQHPEVLGNLNEEPFETLSNKKEAEDFRLRNHRSDCLDLPCFKHCGGGCRFAHTTSSFLPA